MLDNGPDVDAVAICTPPQTHFDAAKLALHRGKHVLLEKPPCATVAQLDHLAFLAEKSRLTLYQTWHSRHAPMVAAAKSWLSTRKIRGATVTWKENVREWHPGQTWIWQAGGFGIFDPGINAISILTEILAEPLYVTSADLHFPSNCEAPIAADIVFAMDGGARIAATFDFRCTGTQTWDIDIVTDEGVLKLSAGGSRLFVDGSDAGAGESHGPHVEYEPVYRRFAQLIEQRQSDVDARPFKLVADTFLICRRHAVEAFIN
jgi:D-galactose 1-dehydrogenase